MHFILRPKSIDDRTKRGKKLKEHEANNLADDLLELPSGFHQY